MPSERSFALGLIGAALLAIAALDVLGYHDFLVFRIIGR